MKAILVFAFDIPEDEDPEPLFRETIETVKGKFKDHPGQREAYIAINEVAERAITILKEGI